MKGTTREGTQAYSQFSDNEGEPLQGNLNHKCYITATTLKSQSDDGYVASLILQKLQKPWE